MTLLDMQRAFSRLLTDPRFQQEFFADGAAAPAEYDLTDRELEGLRAVHRQRLRLHANNLAHARMGLALKSTPLSAMLLHDQLDRYISRYCVEYPPVPAAESAVIVATTRLCEFAERLFEEGLLQPRYAWDLLRYEKHLLVQGFSAASCASAAEFDRFVTPVGSVGMLRPVTGAHVTVDQFQYDLVPLLPQLNAGQRPADPQPLTEPMRIMFVKKPLTALVQTARINAAMESVLNRCDGIRTADEITAQYPNTAPEQVIDALRALNALGAIAFRTDSRQGKC